MRRTQITLQIDPDLVEWMRVEAVRKHSSLSQVARDALVLLIESQEKKTGDSKRG